MAGVRWGTFTCVGWQVTLCDPIWQVTSRSSEMGFPWRAISAFKLENDRFKIYDRCPMTDVAMAISTDADTDADVAYLDHLVTHNSWSRSVIALIAISCYDVISAYIPFTYSGKVSWEIKLSPSAARLPPVAAIADSLVHVMWYTCNPCSDAWRPHGQPGLIIAVKSRLSFNVTLYTVQHSALTSQHDSN